MNKIAKEYNIDIWHGNIGAHKPNLDIVVIQNDKYKYDLVQSLRYHNYYEMSSYRQLARFFKVFK